MAIVPRDKTSDLSGDEWRISVHTKLFRKGNLIYERSYHDFDSASANLPWLLKTWHETNEAIRIDDNELCFQPGCSEKAVAAS